MGAKKPSKAQTLIIELLEWTDTEDLANYDMESWFERAQATLKAEGVEWRDWVSTPYTAVGEVESDIEYERRLRG